MSKPVHPARIGAFVLTGFILFIALLLFFGSGRLFQRSETFLLYFNESVNGLSVGAPVKFKGVEIGRVTDIRIQYDQAPESDAIPVFIEIYTDKLRKRLGVTELNLADTKMLDKQVRLGLRGKLEMQSYVTGLLFVELDYFEDSRPVFVQRGKEYREIPTKTSNVKALMASVTTTLAGVSQVDFAGISKELKGVLSEINTGLKAMDFARVSANILKTSEGLSELVNAPELKGTLKNVEHLTKEIHDITKQFNNDFGPLSRQMRDSLLTVEQAMKQAERALSPESPTRMQLEVTLREVGKAARSLNALVEYLERNPNAVVTGKPSEEKP